MKNDSLVGCRYLPLLRFAVVICAAVCAKQTQALDVFGQQVEIETRFVEVTDNHLSEFGVDLNFGAKYPGFGRPLTSQFQPIAVMPQVDVSRLIKLIEKGGQSHVTTAPVVTAASNEKGTILVEGGVKLQVIPVVKDDGSIGMTIGPEPILVPPGSTLLIGKTVTGPEQKREELLLLMQPHLISGLAPRRSVHPAGTLVEPAVVQSTFNWTGFYVGAQIGYARSQSDYSLKLGGLWELFPDEAEGIEEEADHEFDEDGFGIGGCAGYNYEFQNHVVIGLGIAGRKYWKLSNEFETGDFPSGRSDFDVWSSFNTTGLVTLGPKVGYALGRFFPYVSGGL